VSPTEIKQLKADPFRKVVFHADRKLDLHPGTVSEVFCHVFSDSSVATCVGDSIESLLSAKDLLDSATATAMNELYEFPILSLDLSIFALMFVELWRNWQQIILGKLILPEVPVQSITNDQLQISDRSLTNFILNSLDTFDSGRIKNHLKYMKWFFGHRCQSLGYYQDISIIPNCSVRDSYVRTFGNRAIAAPERTGVDRVTTFRNCYNKLLKRCSIREEKLNMTGEVAVFIKSYAHEVRLRESQFPKCDEKGHFPYSFLYYFLTDPIIAPDYSEWLWVMYGSAAYQEFPFYPARNPSSFQNSNYLLLPICQSYVTSSLNLILTVSYAHFSQRFNENGDLIHHILAKEGRYDLLRKFLLWGYYCPLKNHENKSFSDYIEDESIRVSYENWNNGFV
jgi:hypothetical protein